MKRRKSGDKITFVLMLVVATFFAFRPSLLLKLYNTDVEKEIRIVYQGYKLKDFFNPLSQQTFNSYQVPEDEEPVEKATVVEKKVLSKGNLNYKNVAINNLTDFTIDISELMKDYKHISKSKDMKILIVHTHGTEAYDTEKTARSVDINKNVVAVGQVLADELEKRGYNVLHDVKMHDNPSYNGSYANCLKTVEWYFEHYNDIGIVLDLHRDAIEEKDGSRVKLTYEKDKESYAQLMFVSGSSGGGLKHDNFKENLKFAVSLQGTVNSLYDGLMRPIDFRKERFNQHLHENYLILEVGTHGNTLEEAKKSMMIFADALDKYLNETD